MKILDIRQPPSPFRCLRYGMPMATMGRFFRVAIEAKFEQPCRQTLDTPWMSFWDTTFQGGVHAGRKSAALCETSQFGVAVHFSGTRHSVSTTLHFGADVLVCHRRR